MAEQHKTKALAIYSKLPNSEELVKDAQNQLKWI
jgi:hypothetical protein